MKNNRQNTCQYRTPGASYNGLFLSHMVASCRAMVGNTKAGAGALPVHDVDLSWDGYLGLTPGKRVPMPVQSTPAKEGESLLIIPDLKPYTKPTFADRADRFLSKQYRKRQQIVTSSFQLAGLSTVAPLCCTCRHSLQSNRRKEHNAMTHMYRSILYSSVPDTHNIIISFFVVVIFLKINRKKLRMYPSFKSSLTAQSTWI